MSPRTRAHAVAAGACSALALCVLAMAFLAYPRTNPQVLARFAVAIVVAMVVSALVGALLARYVSAAADDDARVREARLRRQLAEAGHALRTPLAVMGASLDALQRAAPPRDAAGLTLFDGVRDEVRRMSALVHGVLLLARLDVARQPQARERIEVDALVAGVAADARMLAPATAVHVQAASGARVDGDGLALRDALRNLVDNALRHAPGAAIALAARRDGDHVLLSVADDGPGMDEDDAALAFERHYRGARGAAVPGNGLGLAVVEAVAGAMGGSASLHAAPGAGTRVELRLPHAR